MWRFLKEFHYYEPAEKRGIALLLFGILVAVGLLVFSPFRRQAPSPDAEETRRLQTEYEEFVASLHEAEESRTTNASPSRTTYQRREYTPRAEYRRSSPTPAADTLTREEPSLYLPDTAYQRPFKYAEVTVMDLNRVDTTELKKIPGIGSGIANMIVGYRQQLGGFYQVGQLSEIHLDASQLLPWFEVHEEDITRIPVNRSSVERLRSHPYINFYQARALVEYRQRHGDIKNLRQFILYDEFTEQDIERIGHYLSFE